MAFNSSREKPPTGNMREVGQLPADTLVIQLSGVPDEHGHPVQLLVPRRGSVSVHLPPPRGATEALVSFEMRCTLKDGKGIIILCVMLKPRAHGLRITYEGLIYEITEMKYSKPRSLDLPSTGVSAGDPITAGIRAAFDRIRLPPREISTSGEGSSAAGSSGGKKAKSSAAAKGKAAAVKKPPGVKKVCKHRGCNVCPRGNDRCYQHRKP